MCLYITTTCPGSCGTPLFSGELVAACKSSTIKPPPENFSKTHWIDHFAIPLHASEMDRRFSRGYVCSEPSCSQHPSTITTADLNTIFRCPGCGLAGDALVEAWVNGLVVPFLHKSQWASFTCSRREFCHFNTAHEREMSNMVRTIETGLKKSTNPQYGPPWTEADEEMLRSMKAQGATGKNIAAALGRTEKSIRMKWYNLRKADGKTANQ